MFSKQQLESFFSNNKGITLFEKQKDCIVEAINKKSMLIMGETGVGKTLIASFIMKILYKAGVCKKFLILTKTEVLEKMENHVIDYLDVDPSRVGRMKSNNDRDLFTKDYDFYICDYNQIKLCMKYCGGKSLGITSDWGIILDEVQYIKNLSSAIHKTVKKAVKNAVCKFGFSWTPIEKIEDFHGVFEILNPKIINFIKAWSKNKNVKLKDNS